HQLQQQQLQLQKQQQQQLQQQQLQQQQSLSQQQAQQACNYYTAPPPPTTNTSSNHHTPSHHSSTYSAYGSYGSYGGGTYGGAYLGTSGSDSGVGGLTPIGRNYRWYHSSGSGGSGSISGSVGSNYLTAGSLGATYGRTSPAALAHARPLLASTSTAASSSAGGCGTGSGAYGLGLGLGLGLDLNTSDYEYERASLHSGAYAYKSSSSRRGSSLAADYLLDVAARCSVPSPALEAEPDTDLELDLDLDLDVGVGVGVDVNDVDHIGHDIGLGLNVEDLEDLDIPVPEPEPEADVHDELVRALELELDWGLDYNTATTTTTTHLNLDLDSSTDLVGLDDIDIDEEEEPILSPVLNRSLRPFTYPALTITAPENSIASESPIPVATPPPTPTDFLYPQLSAQQQYQHQPQHYHHQQRTTTTRLPQHDDSCEEFNNITDDPTSCVGQKRMMVSRLWNSCFPKFTPEHVHRHNFYLCQWQRNTQVRIVYLFYRWLTAITCLAALVCSLLDIGRTEEHFENHYAKWWIYLTHWGLLFCTVQAWLAAWIVTQGMMVEREDFEVVRQVRKSRLHHIYWVLYTCATVYSFIITMCYWLLVHDPEIHKIDALNIMVHVFNSVIMLIDLAIVGHPIKLSHVYFTTGIGLAYGIFTGIYFIAGGTDRKNNVYIYPMLDWTKPGKAIIVTVCAIIFVVVVHFCCYLLYRTRVWLFTKLCIRGAHNRDGDMGEGLNDESTARLGGGTSQEYSHQQQYPILHSEQPRSAHHHHQHGHPQHTQQQQYQQQQQQQQQYQQQPSGNVQTVDMVSGSGGGTQHTTPPYYPQYSGYQQQPVVAGVNVGVLSAGGYYQPENNNQNQQSQQQQAQQQSQQQQLQQQQQQKHSSPGTGSTSGLSRTVAHLDAAQREQFLNPNKIVEYKM
ncbi:PREDICTED: uncharacterized protein LOC108967788, partial [Bactrocera latifrons]|uniref:uncharacterized protein LOC108967788 n=1 Tax=Bactrocera latifrons TaxID=174628 RepID=UPI0008DC7179